MDGGDSKTQDIEEKRQFEAELQMSSAKLPRTFEGALAALDALITRTPGKGADLLFNRNLDLIKDCVERLALPLSRVKWVHVAGTKGKGSTCAMCESMFRQMGLKTGLYTSPHLLTVRERIRINGESLNEEQFSKSFWHCWDKLLETHSEVYPVLQSFSPSDLHFFKSIVCAFHVLSLIGDVLSLEIRVPNDANLLSFPDSRRVSFHDRTKCVQHFPDLITVSQSCWVILRSHLIAWLFSFSCIGGCWNSGGGVRRSF
jgi:hypothetical protein